MGRRGTRTYEHEGRRKGFYHPKFRWLFDRRAADAEGRRRVGDLTDELCAAVNVEPDTIKAWRYGRNAPGDLETVARIAGFFGVEMDTLLTVEEERKMERLQGAQLDAVSRVYKEIEDYVKLWEYIDPRTWGDDKPIRVKNGSAYAKYASFWYNYTGKMDDYEFDDLWDLVEKGRGWVAHALEREWVYLGAHPVFGELSEFIDDALLKLYDLDYAREEAHKGRRGIMFPEDVIKEAREIISKYL